MTNPDPFGEVLRAMAAFGARMPGLGTGAAAGLKPTGGPLDAVLMQAQMAAAGSLVRAGQRGTEAWLSYARAAGAAGDASARVDAVRAHLRALADIATDEARQVRAQLEALDEQATTAAAAPAATPATAAAAAAPAAMPAAPEPAATDPVRRAQIKP